jgi:hypothetical protein
LRGGEAILANLEVLSVKLADCPHAHRDKDDIEEQDQVGEQGVDGEHNEDNGIVA